MYFEKITKKAPDAWPQVIARAVIPQCGGLGANRACSETRKQYARLTLMPWNNARALCQQYVIIAGRLTLRKPDGAAPRV